MKKLLTTFGLLFTIAATTHAQTPPNAFSYSAVARDANSNPIATTTIGIQISLRQGSPLGTVVYQENHFVNTDQFGLFNLTVGGGSVQSGNISTIDWAAANHYLQVGMDANGGTNFLNMGTTQLLSVPYALYAKSAGSVGAQSGLATVTTLPIGFPGSTSAIGGGNITSDGGTPISQRGVCYSTNPNPTINDNATTDGGGIFGFTSLLTNLNPSTTYYARAYATNSSGTSYGNEMQLFTGGSSFSGSIRAYIQGNTSFSDLLQALTRPGLSQNYLTYLDGSGPFTLFAPTNSAFQSLLVELGVSTINDIPAATLESVLRYHIVNGTLLAGSLAQGQIITTLQGGNITVQSSGGATLLDNYGRVANITAVDISATNGVIHIIDKVLLP